MSKMSLLLSVLWLLDTKKKIKAKEIAEKLELNIRTIYRYIDELNMSGVPIVSETGHNDGYYLLESFTEFPLIISKDKQLILNNAIQLSENIGYSQARTLDDFLEKGNLLTTEDKNKLISFNQMQHYQQHFETLSHALQQIRSIELTYQMNSNLTSRLIDIYAIIYWNQMWYVCAYCHLRKSLRIFRIDRIIDLTPTNQSYHIPKDFDAARFFLSVMLPNLSTTPTQFVKLSCSKSIQESIKKHWYLRHYLLTVDDDVLTFQIPDEMIHNFLPQLLITFGTGIHVIESQSLKNNILSYLNDLIKSYE